MASNKVRVYLNDSKATVRKKLDLEDNEDFSKFEVRLLVYPIWRNKLKNPYQNICSNAYRFKLSLDPTLNWDKLDRPTVTAAQNLIKLECLGARLKLVDKDLDFNDFVEWKLYQLHKPVHARFMKSRISSGMCTQLIDDMKANLYLVATEPAAHAIQPLAGSSIRFDPVKSAAKDAAR